MLRPNETKRGMQELPKEERNASSTSEEPSLLGSAICRRHTSNSEERPSASLRTYLYWKVQRLF